jgi:hypothetical protein
MTTLALTWKLKNMQLTSQIYFRLMVTHRMSKRVRCGRERAARVNLTGLTSYFLLLKYIFAKSICSVQVQTDIEPEPDALEPEPKVQFKVHLLTWTEP